MKFDIPHTLEIICAITNTQVTIRDIHKRYPYFHKFQKWNVSLLYFFSDKYTTYSKRQICSFLLQNESAMYNHLTKIKKEIDPIKMNQIRLIDNAFQMLEKSTGSKKIITPGYNWYIARHHSCTELIRERFREEIIHVCMYDVGGVTVDIRVPDTQISLRINDKVYSSFLSISEKDVNDICLRKFNTCFADVIKLYNNKNIV